VKLTNNLRKIILMQFKDGASVDYLAKLYTLKPPTVEQVLRVKMIEDEGRAPADQPEERSDA